LTGEPKETLQMENTKLLSRLRQLAQLDVDAIGAYEAAMGRVAPPVADKLSSFRVDHVRHIQDLDAVRTQLGGEAIEQATDLKGALLKGVAKATGLLGTRAALLALLGNEELTTRLYQIALKWDLPPDVREVIDRHYQEERRHLDWFRSAIVSRNWEGGASANP
jgi:hypothetical protein